MMTTGASDIAALEKPESVLCGRGVVNGDGVDAPFVSAGSVVRCLLGSLLVVGAVALSGGCRDSSKAAAPPPPPAVKVEPVVEKDVPIRSEWVGTLVGYDSARIRTRVAGYVVSQNYTEGSLVKTGDLLFQVDPRPFQNAVDQAAAKLRQAESQVPQARSQVSANQSQVQQARATVAEAEAGVEQAKALVAQAEAGVEQAKALVAQSEAEVKRAEATQRKTELTVARYTPLAQRGSVSQQELDDAVQNNLANLAAVAAARANLQSAQANVTRTQAAVEKAQADVTRTQAAVDNAQANVTRTQAAVDNAQANVTRAQAAVEKAQADVETAQADVAAARAALAEARLNLGFTKVISPIGGIAGFRVANIGDLVGPSDPAPLTTVSQVDPIYVQFPISEQLAGRVYRRWEADPSAPRTLELELILSDGSAYPKPGKAEILDRQVDVTTGTVMARGVFPNPGNVLRPGQYAKVRAVTEVKKGALLVPQRAVVDQQGLYLVAVVGPDDTVALRKVTVGERVGSLWIVSEGLKPGERIVVEGVEKVKAGEKVKPVPVS